MTWSDYEGAIDSARAELAERFPGQAVVILATFDIAWSGWEGDSRGALITVDGVPMLVAIDQTIQADQFEAEVIAQMPVYRRLLDETARVLRTLWYRRADAEDRQELPSYEDRQLTEIYMRVGYVEHMGLRGRRHVLEALRKACEEAAQFPEEMAHARRLFDDAAREAGIDVLDGPDQVATPMPDGEQPRTPMDDYIDADMSVLRGMRPTRVVCTPGTCGGRPRIDGTRLDVSTLLTNMRNGMTVEEISQEWAHLPEGWFEAIIAWLDEHGEQR